MTGGGGGRPSAGDTRRSRMGGAPARSVLFAVALPLLLLVLPSAGNAQDGDRPIVRARIETETPVMVGETVTLSVDVLTPSWFPRAPELPAALDVENAVAVFDDSFRVNLSERVGSDTWSGIRRRYLIHPQLAGPYSVPPIEVRVVYALPNARPSEPLTLAAPEMRFEVRVPPEAAGLGYFIAARDFTLEQDVEPKPEGLRVGDALTRTITLRAIDASSMMLPITEFPSIDGLSVYPDPTRASDRGGERGSAREATRIDAATYVLETEGSYTLPEVRISWWDVTAERLREESVPAVALHVAPNPDLVAEIALPEEREETEAGPVAETPSPWWRSRELLLGLAAVVLLVGLFWRYGPVLRTRRDEASRRRRESEVAYFDRVIAACARNDAPGAMRALLAWVDRTTPPGIHPTVRRMLDQAGDPALAAAVRDLETTLFGRDETTGWRGQPLAEALERARRSGTAAGGVPHPPLLSPLNPTA